MVNYLPIGSVVKLKGIGKRLVIVGIIQMEQGNTDTLHDYMGVPYPEGSLGPGMNFLFDHDKIEEVIFRGFEDDERRGFMITVEQALGVTGEPLDILANQTEGHEEDA